MGIQVGGVTAASTSGKAITAGAAGGQGSWVEFIASTSETSNLILVTVWYNGVGARTSGAVILGVGAAGAEVEKFRTSFHLQATVAGRNHFLIPLTIASGSRVAMAFDADPAANNSALAVIHLFSADNLYKSNAFFSSDFSANGGAGVTVDPGGTAHTKGAWVQVDASAGGDSDWVLVSIGTAQNAAAAVATWLVDIGTGEAASEAGIITNLPFATDTSEIGQAYYVIPLPIASGSRIAVRAQCSINDATDRLIDVNILGINTDALPSGGGGTTGYVSVQ
jgi:hypothetical protein